MFKIKYQTLHNGVISILFKVLIGNLFILTTTNFINAEELSGFYLSGKVGLSFQQQLNRKIAVLDTDLVTGAATSDNLDFGNSTKLILSGGGVGGYDFKPRFNVPIRVELEYIVRNNGDQSRSREHVDFDLLVPNHGDNAFGYTSSIRTQTAMLNLYWDFDTATSFTPYATVGLGLANHRFKNKTNYMMMGNTGIMQASSTINNFSWSIGAGVAYQISDSWAFDLGYRYIDAGKLSANSSWRETYFIDARINTKTELDIKYHDIALGIRYNF